MSPKYPTRQLGRNGPVVSAIGFGTMGIGAFYGKTDKEEALKTLTYAADRGCVSQLHHITAFQLTFALHS
ncbi:hypothetical protein M422DRAFT_247625 [Sphaerobolus stellatus SS14]|nr:hypothetical protein M422DRAFT_247625 [Sphaerobolus stellatus SS14]